MRIQCKSNAHRSHPHCIVRSQIHACMLTSCGHTSTQLPWCPRQIFTSASRHISSRVEQICGTQCVARRSTLTVGSRHERACHTLFDPHAIVRSRSIQIETTSGSGLIMIRSGLGECTFSVDAQTGFDQVQCALGVQCGQALVLAMHPWIIIQLLRGQQHVNQNGVYSIIMGSW